MIFSNDMIKSILEDHLFANDIYQNNKFQCGFDELVEGITIELNMIADTEHLLCQIEQERQMLQEAHQKAMHKIKVSRAEVISQCRHHSTTMTVASDGNDSSTTCDTCDTCGTCEKEL